MHGMGSCLHAVCGIICVVEPTGGCAKGCMFAAAKSSKPNVQVGSRDLNQTHEHQHCISLPAVVQWGIILIDMLPAVLL